MPAKVAGTSPVELATPALLKIMTFALLGEAVKDGRIPIVQISVEVVVENKWQPAPLPPTSVRETNAVCLNKLRRGRNCLYECSRCDPLFFVVEIGDF